MYEVLLPWRPWHSSLRGKTRKNDECFIAQQLPALLIGASSSSSYLQQLTQQELQGLSSIWEVIKAVPSGVRVLSCVLQPVSQSPGNLLMDGKNVAVTKRGSAVSHRQSMI